MVIFFWGIIASACEFQHNDGMASKPAQLSPKQQAYSESRAANGISKTAAFRKVYEASGSPNDAVQAHHIERNINVSSSIDELYKLALCRPTRSASEMRAAILANIEAKLNSENEAISLKASEMLGRIPSIDLWQEHGRSDDDALDSEAIRARLRNKLASLIGAPAPSDAVVDVEPQVDSGGPGVR